ncbi:hypothetical protein [Desulfatibacillum aliphaticivorans]|uniref:Uncharacterized protein n=1 Tax=Desulfatibacillum aliphaticivorans TaxID=218208 RepID=B8FHM2_DESAL|nr:hypothetical protein [Desulfatibacillum aliphaticivorans]ACL02439.1 hypothetical protein Dalk_0734 [Desulfatibacillum aliphaticivorans]
MEELVVVTNGDWRFLLEGKGADMVVWPYYKDEPVYVEAKRNGALQKNIHYRKIFPYPNNYWEKSTKILAWCKRFAKTRKFRDGEIKEFAEEMAINPLRV